MSARLDVRLDWRAYWDAFRETHGGDPVPFGNRLLFRDGYMYSGYDYQGPEWPPSSERLPMLRKFYWNARRKHVEGQLTAVGRLLQRIRELKSVRSAPLQEVQRVHEDGRVRLVRRPLDEQRFVERANWLVQDLLSCEEELAKL
jgi:hypothetical protein